MNQTALAAAMQQAAGKSPAKSVAAEKQWRAAQRKLDKASVVVVQGERQSIQLPVAPAKPTTPETALRGGEARVHIEATETRSAIVTLFKTTELRGLDMVAGKVGATRAAKLFALFKRTGKDTLSEALDLKKSGFPQGSFEYQTLSEANTFLRLYRAGMVDKVSAPKFIAVNGQESTSWRERLTLARALLKQHGEEKQTAKINAEAFGAVAAKMPDATPETLAAEASKIAASKVEEIKAKKEEKKEERSTPDKTAERDVRRFLKSAEKDGLTESEACDWLEAYARAITKKALLIRATINAQRKVDASEKHAA